MKLFKLFVFFLPTMTLINCINADQKTPLPEKIPFGKCLPLTAMSFFRSHSDDTEMVTTFMNNLAECMIIETKAADVIRPCKQAWRGLKAMIADTVFKDEQDLLKVCEQLEKDMGTSLAWRSIKETQRDKLERFDATAPAIFGSETYEAIKAATKDFLVRHEAYRTHPLIEKIKAARGKLKKFMRAFLQQRYTSAEEMQADFHKSIKHVNQYLDGIFVS